jgi:DNA-binding transcriptional MerR regulator
MAAQPSVLATESPNQLTIEQLAAQSGMTVRNIRSHQARGLVSPPEVRIRVGYYGPDHREQLRVIQHLQSAGFNLRGIQRLFSIAAELADRGVPLRVILDALDATRDTEDRPASTPPRLTASGVAR